MDQTVSMELCVWLLEIQQNSIKVWRMWMIATSSRMSWPEGEWRCVWEGDMGQCVMTTGTMKMPLSSAINWDSHNMVH